MIDHISVPVTDITRSRAFYAAALAPLGYEVLLEPHPRASGLGVRPKPDLWLALQEPGAAPPAHYGAFVLDPDGHNVEAVCHHG